RREYQSPRKSLLLRVLNDLRSHFAVTREQTHHGDFADAPAPLNLRLTLALVHEASLAADVSFVNLDFAGKLLKRAFLHGEADTVQEKPCALLRDSQSAGNLARTNAVLRVGNQPDCREPLIQTDR